MRKLHQRKLHISLLISLLLFSLGIGPLFDQGSLIASGNQHSHELEKGEVPLPPELEYQDEWIVKWKGEYTQPKSDGFKIISVDKERRLLLIRLSEDTDIHQWYATWSKKKEIEYVEPNFTMKISSKPNDPDYTKQAYVQQINAEEGWRVEQGNEKITIAILDTGIDLTHPDLKGQLVTGMNLVDPKKSPQDDNGHGTQIAGILGAKGNNRIGVTGILWSSKLMPVKVLDQGGEGKPFTVSQGIYQSVDKGVSIVLLSLGDPIYTKTLQEAVEYAEEKGVLVVAATGNEGSRVNYPAAFPTVFAVGAVTDSLRPASYSNSGPEVNVVGIGNVYTTKLNNSYGTASGTSMAAPQVAGLAALIMSRYPQLKPSEVRNHIMYTSRDLHQKGWDSQTGYGLINIGKALTTQPIADIYEPNDRLQEASMFPIETMVRAELRNMGDVDWYKIETPYRGKLQFSITLDMSKSHGVDVTFFPNGKEEQSVLFNVKKDRVVTVNAPAGTSYLRVKYNIHERRTTPLAYEIINQFTIYEDAQQPNDSKGQATRLDGNGKIYTGTFHRDGLLDWFYFDAPTKGEIDLHVTVDTIRLDPVVVFERPNGRSQKIDDGNSNNGQEERLITEVDKGRHYFRISHYYGHKVNGEYNLRLSYRPYFEDKYEPNNTRDTATRITSKQVVEANIDTNNDVDWYRIQLTQESYLNLNVSGIPAQVGLTVSLQGQDQREIATRKQKGSEASFSLGDKLRSGTYYIKVSSDKSFPFQSYKLQAVQQELISGYRDIQGHWAFDDIVKASEAGLIQGVGDYRFAPNDKITRAATAAILQRMYQFPKPSTTSTYRDLSVSHWAYADIQRVSAARVMRGLQDDSFGTNQNVSRAEIAVIFDRILFGEVSGALKNQYKDVSERYWAYSSIMRLTEAGLFQGDKAGTFRPTEPMSRAEFVTFINRVREK